MLVAGLRPARVLIRSFSELLHLPYDGGSTRDPIVVTDEVWKEFYEFLDPWQRFSSVEWSNRGYSNLLFYGRAVISCDLL